MEDLWCVQNCGIDVNDFADFAEYKRFLDRFNREEETEHRRRLLYGEDGPERTVRGSQGQ